MTADRHGSWCSCEACAPRVELRLAAHVRLLLGHLADRHAAGDAVAPLARPWLAAWMAGDVAAMATHAPAIVRALQDRQGHLGAARGIDRGPTSDHMRPRLKAAAEAAVNDWAARRAVRPMAPAVEGAAERAAKWRAA